MNCRKAFLTLIIIFLIYILFKTAYAGGSTESVKIPLVVDNFYYNIEGEPHPDAGFVIHNTSMDSIPNEVIIGLLDKTVSEAENFIRKSLNKSKYTIESVIPLNIDKIALIKGVIYTVKSKREKEEKIYIYEHTIGLFFNINNINKCNIYNTISKSVNPLPNYCVKKDFNSVMINSDESTVSDEKTCLDQLGKPFSVARSNLKTPIKNINTNIDNNDNVDMATFKKFGNTKYKNNVCLLEPIKPTDTSCEVIFGRGFFAPGTTPDMLISPIECPFNP